jgi:peptidoglycan hydrolase-like protein with peptidoglycan-binding domain
MQPYNYTIDLPKPPADNFLQNVMGIAQLQQMGQQQKIQAQQAAFQKEMQPLEMDKVREQIKAAQASAAQSAASTRGLNLSADEVKRQQDYIKEVDSFTSKPVSEWAKEDVQRLAALSITKDAKIGKGLQDFYASRSKPELELIDNYATKAGIAISQGRKDIADKIAKQGIAEAEKLGFKTASAFFKFGDSQIAEDPAEAYATIVGHLARDENKLKQFISASELKGKLAKAEEETKAEKTKAEQQEAQARLARADARLKELKATGKLDSEEAMKQENTMRSEFLGNPFLRTFPVRNQAYNEIIKAERSPTGDGSKITSFIKLQDPSSVVSVTEKGQITSTTPIASLQALINKFTNDGILDDKTRNDIDKQSKNIFEIAKASYQKEKNNTIAIAKRYGLNPDNIIPAYDTETEQQPAPSAQASGQSAEEQRMRSLLRPAAGFGNTMTPSQIPFQGSTFQGRPADVDVILKQLGVQ